MISEALMRAAISASTDSIVITEAGDSQSRPIVFVNQAFLKLSGYSEAECLGRDCRFMNTGLGQQEALEELSNALSDGVECHIRIRNKRKNGTLFWNELNVSPVFLSGSETVTHFIGVQHDVTDAVIADETRLRKLETLKAEQEHMDALLNTDALTGIANRRAMDDSIENLFASFATDTDASSRSLMLLRLDIDYFRAFNSIAGHNVGDEALKRIAKTLEPITRSVEGRLARYGGDEFVVVARGVSLDDARRLADELRAAILALRIENLGASAGYMTASIGGAVAEQPRTVSIHQLWRTVDAAAYIARGTKGLPLGLGDAGDSFAVHACTAPQLVSEPISV